MPTPSDETSSVQSTIARSAHTTCPPEPEDECPRRSSVLEHRASRVRRSSAPESESSSTASSDEHTDSTGSTETRQQPPSRSPALEEQFHDARSVPTRDAPSPAAPNGEMKRDVETPSQSQPAPAVAPVVSSMTSSHHRPVFDDLEPPSIPRHTSSFLRHGSKFGGTQQSDRQVYNVQVEIKHVDMVESFICGYLRIEGLTADHPTLTTYFEGEVIGTKYEFQTRHEEWGSSQKVDMQHWRRFSAFKPLVQAAQRPDFTLKNYAEREHIFMRWKERFLVPDHKVRTIQGASFEGFYYICFNQVSGTVSGIYFHSKSEKFQQLELKHIDDQGCMGAMELR